MLGIVPTTRAAACLALAAPLALVIGAIAPQAWLMAPALAGTILLLILIDALLAGNRPEIDFQPPLECEVGAEMNIPLAIHFSMGLPSKVIAILGGDGRLLHQGRCEVSLQNESKEYKPAQSDKRSLWTARLLPTPSRRGIALLTSLWIQWHGPLGLGARQMRIPQNHNVRILPNIQQVRSPAMQAFLRDSRHGLIARRIRGEGSQFEALIEYQAGMDRRRIDWKASARHTQLYAREYETERDNQIVFAFDCGQNMCEPVEGMPRIDRAVSAALTASYIALKNHDRVSFFGFAARPTLSTPFFVGSDQFHRLQQSAATLDYHAQEANFTLALASLTNKLRRRSLVIVFSDFTDATSAELMVESVGRLLTTHVVLFVTMVDAELESLARSYPDDEQKLARSATAETLLQQRTAVTQRLRHMGVHVLEAPYDHIGSRLIDSYLSIKQKGIIG